MAIIIILITISLAIALGFLGSFFWSLKRGQFDDTYTPSVRMLFEDKPKLESGEKSTSKNEVPES